MHWRRRHNAFARRLVSSKELIRSLNSIGAQFLSATGFPQPRPEVTLVPPKKSSTPELKSG